MKLNLIENWKHGYKYVTVQLSVLAGILVAAAPHIPEIAAVLPPDWQLYVFAAIAIARIIKQTPKGVVEEPKDDLPKNP